MNAATSKGAARAIADLASGTILATVEIKAPIDRVFQALTRSEEVVRWWGSADTYRTTEWTTDLRVGGQWRGSGVGADGRAFSVGGEFLEVDPPRKLVQTWKPDWDGGNVTTITYRLDTIASGTRVTIRHEGFAGRPESCAGHSEGWERVLSWLGAYAAPAQPQADAPAQYFLCKLLPPRPTFPGDMTPAEAKAMQEHVVYWTELLEKGTAIVFGPVADQRGAWGLCVVRVKDEGQLKALQNNDPVIRAGIGFGCEASPMLKAVHKA